MFFWVSAYKIKEQQGRDSSTTLTKDRIVKETLGRKLGRDENKVTIVVSFEADWDCLHVFQWTVKWYIHCPDRWLLRRGTFHVPVMSRWSILIPRLPHRSVWAAFVFNTHGKEVQKDTIIFLENMRKCTFKTQGSNRESLVVKSSMAFAEDQVSVARTHLLLRTVYNFNSRGWGTRPFDLFKQKTHT